MSRLLFICFILISVAVNVSARCPNWCNQRGICTAPNEGGHCVCNMGFAGEDCSQRLCPANFDPVGLETITSRRAVRMETGSISGVLSGKVEFTFAGASVFIPANANSVGSGECQSIVSNLKSVASVNCVRESANPTTNGGSYLITLNSFPSAPFMNNLVFHTGNPGRNMFFCNTSHVDEEDALGPYCRISDVEPEGPVPVYAECSNHGSCDRVYGKCACERGFKGDACDDMRDAEDIVTHTHDGPFFSGSLMRLDVQRDPSEVFALFSARINGQNVTTITGDRRLVHEGDLLVRSGLVVGSSAGSNDANVYSALISSQNEQQQHHIRASLDNEEVFSVDRHGNTRTQGSFSADNGTFSVSGGTVLGQDMKLSNNLEVAGSLNVEDSLTIGSGFALTPGGMTVDVETHTGTLFELRSRQEGFNGSLLEIHTLGEKSSVIKAVSNGLTTFELASSGQVRMQGLRLTSGGVLVESGGLQVQSGGVQVKGGLTVEGNFDLVGADLKLGSVDVAGSADNLKDPLMAGRVGSRRYVGSVLELSAEPQENGLGKFSYASFKQGEQTVFDVNSEGTIEAQGAVIQGARGLSVKGPSRLLGGLQLQRTSVKPTLKASADSQWVASIPAEATYVVVEAAVSAQDTFQVELVFETRMEGTLPPEGRLVVVTNRGARTTKGVAAIPSQSTVILVFNGQQWVDIEALKAPMHVLKEVTTFEAAADLNIGNHSFSAFSLSASALEKGRVIFAGSNGLLIDNDKFTFVKGVLSAPALKVDKLQANLDAKGYEINNAVLVNPKLEGATIKAADVTIAGESGVAYFNQRGALVGSPSLSLDAEGHLLISELRSNVDLTGHTMSNVVLVNGKLERIQSAEVSRLMLSGAEHEKGSLLMLNQNGEVVSMQDLLATNAEGDVLIHSLKVDTLMGPLDANDQPLENVNIVSGSAISVDRIDVKRLAVEDLKVTNAAPGATRLVFADAAGKLQTHSDEDSQVKIPNLAVDRLTFARGHEVDLSGNILKNVKFDADSVDFGLQNNFEVNSMKIHELSKQDTTGKFLTANAAGKLEHLRGITLREGGALDLGSEGSVVARAVRTQSLTVSDLRSSSLLGANSEGRLVPLRALEVDSATVARDLTLAEDGHLSLSSLRSTLLAADATGRVIGLNSAEGAATIPISVKSITSDLIVSAVAAKGPRAEYESIYITSKEGVEGNILIKQEDGLIAPFTKGHLDPATGALHINHLQPVSPKDTLHVASALVVDSNVSFSAIHASPSISTQTLSVAGVSDFNDDVAVDGTLTVHGNVIGSGPYVDSSDSRFKKNVEPLNNSLEMVLKLNAVTYDFRTEDFPERDFPSTRQIGYVADEVMSVVPELVVRDKDGYLGVSYARAAVIAAEAVKEHKAQTDLQIGRLTDEVAQLRGLVEELLKRVTNCEKS